MVKDIGRGSGIGIGMGSGMGKNSNRKPDSLCPPEPYPEPYPDPDIRCPMVLTLFALLFFLTLPAFAGMREIDASATPHSSLPSSLDRLSILAGPAVLTTESTSVLMATAAMRYRIMKSWPVFFEAGGILPFNTSGSLEQESDDSTPFRTRANVNKFSEEHLAAVADFPIKGLPDWLTPEAALGVSFAQFNNQTYSGVGPGAYPTLRTDSSSSTVALYDRIGVKFGMPWPAWSCVVDTGYVSYRNKPSVGGGTTTFNLDVSGWVTSAQVEWRI